jgi:hypothetical protein
LNGSRLAVSEILDDAAEAAMRVAAPWMGLLWLCSLPLRFVQVHFAARLLELGPRAGEYGNYLHGLAFAATAALLPSLWARAVFVRACGLGLREEAAPGRITLKVPPAAFADYVYVALLAEVLFYGGAPSLVAPPLAILLAGLAAASHPYFDRPGLLAPLRETCSGLVHGRVLAALLLVFAVALLIVFVNLYFVFQIGLWLAGAMPGVDPTPWEALLSADNRAFLLVLLAGAILAVEPFWIAALTVFAHKARSRDSGEDLRLWFERLKRRQAA